MKASKPARRRVLTAIFWGLIAVPWLNPSALAQDITLHETVTISGMPMGGGKPQTNTKYFSGNAMRDSSSEGNDAIFRLDQGKMILIDHKKKTYSEMTFDEMQKMMSKSMAGLEHDKEGMDEVKKMMGVASGQLKVTKQGAGENIAGYATEKYLISMGPMEIEVWSSPALRIPPAYYDALKMRAPRNPMFDMSRMYDEFKKIQGMTMKSVTAMKMGGMAMTTTTVVTSVEKGTIPASTFEIPAGYKAAPMKF